MASESKLIFSLLLVQTTHGIFQWMERPVLQHRNDQTSRCQTNISLPTKFSFCKISQSRSQRISFFRYSTSALYRRFCLTISDCVLHLRYPNLHEVRLIPTKKDIAFVEFTDEASSTVAKDALHNYKLDGENKIKVCFSCLLTPKSDLHLFQITFARKWLFVPCLLSSCTYISLLFVILSLFFSSLRTQLSSFEVVFGFVVPPMLFP